MSDNQGGSGEDVPEILQHDKAQWFLHCLGKWDLGSAAKTIVLRKKI